MSEREVVILSGVRTAIGDYGGALKDTPPSELGARVVREAVARAKVDPKEIGQCVFGNVIHTEPKDMYLSRVACVNGGLPVETGALTLNRLCGSGLQAIVSASQYILMGDVDAAVAGGAESMSRAAYMNTTQRWGTRMGDAKNLDAMTGALSDPFDSAHMGVTAENVASKCGITREQQDAFAVESHKRAANAIASGYFKDQILPIELKTRKGPVQFDTDEHVRGESTLESMAKLKAVFIKENGTVTAGNASGLNDAAAAVVLMEKSVAAKKGLKPMARLVAYGHAGIDPKIMGLGPVSAVKSALAKAGLRIERGVRRAGARCEQGARDESGEGQSQWRRHCPGPPDRRHRRNSYGQGDVRAASHRRALRAHHDVHRRRAGNRRNHRTRLTDRGIFQEEAMAVSMYQASVPVFVKGLTNLRAILDKATAHAEAKKIDGAVFLNARLFPDMVPLSGQVQIASDMARGTMARLTGNDPQAWEDDEKTIPDLVARVDKTLDYLKSFTALQIEGTETREIKRKIGGQERTFTGLNYLLQFSMPNFYFHTTTAYDILRHNGVEIGKLDFLGSME